MFRRHVIIATASTTAPLDSVFALVADGSTWPNWCASVDRFVLEREGEGMREGPGAIRSFGFKGRTTRAEILEVRPNALLRYKLLSGLPFFDYEGKGVLSPGQIRWEIAFRVKTPGRSEYWRRYMDEFLTEFVQELSAHAEKLTTA
jgi:uncharacterized protein YndB with AHSA1/START domain